MARLLTIKAQDSSRNSSNVAIFAPISREYRIKDAILVAGENETFSLWQDVAWYFSVDPELSSIVQRPGANLQGATILVLLEV